MCKIGFKISFTSNLFRLLISIYTRFIHFDRFRDTLQIAFVVHNKSRYVQLLTYMDNVLNVIRRSLEKLGDFFAQHGNSSSCLLCWSHRQDASHIPTNLQPGNYTYLPGYAGNVPADIGNVLYPSSLSDLVACATTTWSYSVMPGLCEIYLSQWKKLVLLVQKCYTPNYGAAYFWKPLRRGTYT